MITSYIWKYPKERKDNEFVQKSIALVDMSETELRNCYKHCISMLDNNSKTNPGRYIVLKDIEKQMANCGVELFIRWMGSLEITPRYTRDKLLLDITTFINKNREHFKTLGEKFEPTEHTVSEMFGSIPPEFQNINLEELFNGTVDRLGQFDKSHLTNSFIYKMGLWLSKEELAEFTIINGEGKLEDRVKLVKERLSINPQINIFINPNGLTFDQLRSALNLKTGKKYLELTTSQLETLRYKLLPVLSQTVALHISQWEQRIKEIKEVAEYNKYKL